MHQFVPKFDMIAEDKSVINLLDVFLSVVKIKEFSARKSNLQLVIRSKVFTHLLVMPRFEWGAPEQMV